jgi:RNA polymerase-binding transcription factor DksA
MPTKTTKKKKTVKSRKSSGTKAGKFLTVSKLKAKKTGLKQNPVKTAAEIKPVRRRKPKRATRTYLTQKELNHFKKILLEQKKEIMQNAERLRESLVDDNTGDYVGENQTYSLHMAEQGTDEMEREKNYLFMQRDEKYLRLIDLALKRIEDKTYGICIECKYEPKGLCKTCPFIPKDRLEIVPVTQHCVECKNLRTNHTP